MNSSWREDRNRSPGEPDNLYQTGLTLTELQMITHLRMLSQGRYTISVAKESRGRDGTTGFEIKETFDKPDNL